MVGIAMEDKDINVAIARNRCLKEQEAFFTGQGFPNLS